MKTIRTCLVALSLSASVLVALLLPASTTGQSTKSDQMLPTPTVKGDRIFYPPEMSPLDTSVPIPEEQSLTPSTKFVKYEKAIPNQYIVILNDDAVSSKASLSKRRAGVAAIANSQALAHLGKVGHIYETALKGYSIELPNEAEAKALSENPVVRWVQEDVQGEWSDTEALQLNPPWGLDAIDGTIPAATPDSFGRTSGPYVYNATGTGVQAYTLDSGINRLHTEFTTPFFSRASQAADCFTYVNCQSGQQTGNLDQCVSPMPNSNNNDCFGHGTHVAGTLAGTNYGVAKDVTIGVIKVGGVYGPILSSTIAAVNWVTSVHQANPGVPIVANMSIQMPAGAVDLAVSNSIAAGVTYVVAAGNSNADARNYSPAAVQAALTVGAVDWTGTRPSFSNWGPRVDLFAPGVMILSSISGGYLGCIWDGSNSSYCQYVNGTSQAAPHVAGAVALYLQGRTGMSNCSGHPIQGTSSASVSSMVSTCPDRVARFINSNANLNKLTGIAGIDPNTGLTVNSPNRFLWTQSIPTRTNPIDNQRFFVWTQYNDFLPYDPDPGGLAFWTGQITNNCGTGNNDNNACTRNLRNLVSKEFFRVAYPAAFNDNLQFVQRCYQQYLRRNGDSGGIQFWLGVLNSYGTPASEEGKTALIDAFIGDPANAAEYRRRFGQP